MLYNVYSDRPYDLHKKNIILMAGRNARNFADNRDLYIRDRSLNVPSQHLILCIGCNPGLCQNHLNVIISL